MHSLWTTIARSARLRTRRETAGMSAAIERLCGKIRETFGATRGQVLVTPDRGPGLTPIPGLRREFEAVLHLTRRARARPYPFPVIHAIRWTVA